MFEVFYQTGIRLNELIQLKEQDVTDQTIKVLGKRNKERIIPIAAELSKKITAYRLAKKKCIGETKTLSSAPAQLSPSPSSAPAQLSPSPAQPQPSSAPAQLGPSPARPQPSPRTTTRPTCVKEM